MNANKNKAINRRAIWQLIKPYWVSEQCGVAWSLFALIVALVLVLVYINVLITDWNRTIFDAIQNKDYPAFKHLMWQFTYLAFLYITVATARIYLGQLLQIRWRTWMTDKYLGKWLEHQAYYRMEQGHTADNPDQRIAEDLRSLASGSLSLVLGFISSAVTLVSFVGILWSVSGPVSFMLMQQQWTIPGYMVWFAITYAGVGSWVIWWIGRPLVSQSFNQERFEANYRFGLIRVREHAEAIALYRGEARERGQLNTRFEDIRQNWHQIMHTTKRLNIGVNFYAQFAIIFPLLVAAPRYFSNAISLGVLMQISSAFGQVQDALSWFINVFSTLADWKASVNRLAGFNQAVEQAIAQREGIAITHNDTAAIEIDQLDLRLPDGRSLVSGVQGQITAGSRILVSGPSGCGKSTLFRAIAGIWPYGSGAVQIPAQARIMFVPQISYLPIGSLRAALAYPAEDNAYDDATLKRCLQWCRLPHLQDALDVSHNWSNQLSPGEQQRLAFARVLLSQPEILFLDEASSAMDDETEQALYELVQQQLPQAAIISIAHRQAVARYHRQRWHFTRIAGAGAEPGYTLRIEALP